MARSRGRKILIWAGVYLAGAALVGSVAQARRGDRQAAEDLGQLAFAGLVVGLVVFAVWWFRILPRRRSAAAHARRLGLRFSPTDPFDLASLPFPLFRRAQVGRGVSNVMWGTWNGLAVTLFDYFDPGTGEPVGDRSREFSCAMTGVSPSWPDLVVEPEGIVSRLADLAGLRDIELESEAFNRAYEVRCADPRFAGTLLDARMMAWLLELGPGWGFQVARSRLLCFGPPRRPWEVQQVLTTLAGFVGHVPSVVGSLYPPPPAPPRPDA